VSESVGPRDSAVSRRPPYVGIRWEPAEGQIAHSDCKTLSRRALPVNAEATTSMSATRSLAMRRRSRGVKTCASA
jgi:hypothetical protein